MRDISDARAGSEIETPRSNYQAIWFTQNMGTTSYVDVKQLCYHTQIRK